MRIRKILIPSKELRKIEEDRERWLPKGLETGGYIFGRIHPNGVAEVVSIIDGGPNAERTAICFSGDNEYATKVKDELREKDPEIRLLGEYHLHPWNGQATLSRGDLHQLKVVKQLRPWFTVFLTTGNEIKVWDLREDDLEAVEVPYQILDIGKEDLLDRILRITRHEVLVNKTALIVGLGSGGSVVAKYLGCTGIGRIILVDNEELEVANVIRHEGGVEKIGKRKTEICREVIEAHNPFTVVETYDFDVTKNIGKIEELAADADLIIGSSGSAKVNNVLNGISIEGRKPVVYGGVYERALGGYILAVKPFETACYNCIFGLGLEKQSYSVDKEAAQRYGLDEEELHKQQGLWIDISIPALLLSKIALAMLEEKQLDYNLVLYDSSYMEIRKLRVARRNNCAVCNEEGWMKEILGNEKPFAHKLKEFLSRRIPAIFKRNKEVA